jgi:hypothetical protein
MKKTNRTYKAIIKKSKVNMGEAVQELAANSFKLLNIIYYYVTEEKDLEDKSLMKLLNVSRRPFYNAKEQLKEKGYIKIVQVGSTKYKWFVGKKAIQKDNEKYEPKYKKDREEYAKLVLNIQDKESCIISNNYSGVYSIDI